MNIGPFLLAVIAVIINGVPQLLYAQARGFALKPAGFAYLVGAFGNLVTGSVTPISSQAETITVASVDKDLRNNANRRLNCDSANIDKTVAAAAQQIADIRLIEEKKGLSSLPEELMELARLRLHNPELSLRELGEQLSVPISRSGVNHRLKRLHTMALELREKSDKQEKEERR